MIGGVDFVALPTRDYDKAAEFYGETLGLPFRKRWGEMPAGEFQAGNLTIALMQMDAFGQEFKPHGSPLAFHVDDFDAAKSQLEAKGVRFQMDPIDSGVCKMVFFNDPDGNTIGIHHRYAPGG
jgi:catechol 2,3-dioxygenase-like lactoylglutathione lyase family enzyme